MRRGRRLRARFKAAVSVGAVRPRPVLTLLTAPRTAATGSRGARLSCGAVTDRVRHRADTNETAEVVVEFGDVELPGWGLEDLDAAEVGDATAEFYRAPLAGLGRPPGGSPSEARRSFRRCHAGDPAGAELTALFMCTDRHLRAASGTLPPVTY